jgi:hypothetical protein
MAYLVKASTYYGRTTPGWVAVVHGYPWHFSGRTGKKEAETVVNKANKT